MQPQKSPAPPSNMPRAGMFRVVWISTRPLLLLLKVLDAPARPARATHAACAMCAAHATHAVHATRTTAAHLSGAACAALSLSLSPYLLCSLVSLSLYLFFSLIIPPALSIAATAAKESAAMCGRAAHACRHARVGARRRASARMCMCRHTCRRASARVGASVCVGTRRRASARIGARRRTSADAARRRGAPLLVLAGGLNFEVLYPAFPSEAAAASQSTSCCANNVAQKRMFPGAPQAQLNRHRRLKNDRGLIAQLVRAYGY